MDIYNILNDSLSLNSLSFIFFFVIVSNSMYAIINSSFVSYGLPSQLSCSLSFSVFSIASLLLFISLDFNVNYSFYSDFLSSSFSASSLQFILFFSSFFILILCKDSFKVSGLFKFEYDVLILFCLFGLVLLCNSQDLLVIYLAIELQSLAFYVLATFRQNSEYSTESGIKYFILGGFSSCLLLFGFSTLYAVYGSSCFETLGMLALFSDNAFFTIISLIFILSALLFKLGAVPFHFWVCDVYEGCLTSITAFFATVPKIILIALMLNFLYSVFSSFAIFWSYPILFSGFFSVFIASILALYQKRIKRLLAYSGISHIGFVLLAVSCYSTDSLKSSILYLIIYITLNIAIFGFVLISLGKSLFFKYLVNWVSTLGRSFSFLSSFVIVLFSLAGIPPFSGFLSKMSVITSLVAQDLIFTSLLVILTSCIASFYYIRLIKVVSFTNSYRNNEWILANSRNTEIIVCSFSMLALLFIFRSNFFVSSSYLISALLV